MKPLNSEIALIESSVHSAVASVDDPEYPGISIVELGLLETLEVKTDGTVVVGLIPTFSGCPALAMIADEIRSAVGAVAGIGGAQHVEVRWLNAPVWTTERITKSARDAIARDFTVGVHINGGPVACPQCGSATNENSMFGSSRCRAIHFCSSCTEVVEVIRS